MKYFCFLVLTAVFTPFWNPLVLTAADSGGERVSDESVLTAPLHVPAGADWLAIRLEERCRQMSALGEKIEALMIGDSITHLWTWDKPNDPINEPYRGDAVWARYFDEPAVFNFAFDGASTQSTLDRLHAAPFSAIHPKVVVVLIGTNNISAGQSPEQVVEGIVAVEEKLRLVFSGVQILQLAIFPRGESPNDPKRKMVVETNQRLKERVKDQADVTFLDLTAEFLNPDGTISPSVMPDFLHVNPNGFEIWGRAMKPILDRLRTQNN